MKILYYSCHEILEYDEVRLLRSLGHDVFSIGCCQSQVWKFRPALEQGALEQAADLFERECVHGADYRSTKISRQFIDCFDAIIVMSEAGFITKNWTLLKDRPVIWRTVGMGVEAQEYLLEAQRAEGLKIVRYSAAERRNPAYLGEDALIRFYVDEAEPWVGDEETILTFANRFADRHPSEFAFFERATTGLRRKIGGAANLGVGGATGSVSNEDQKIFLRDSRAYFYCHGTYIPYTLNFIEAWTAGIPVVAVDPRQEGFGHEIRYAEVPDLILDGETGFLVGDELHARRVLRDLLDDQQLARTISASARSAASALFSRTNAETRWQRFLARL